jgi:hypothetical protein
MSIELYQQVPTTCDCRRLDSCGHQYDQPSYESVGYHTDAKVAALLQHDVQLYTKEIYTKETQPMDCPCKDLRDCNHNANLNRTTAVYHRYRPLSTSASSESATPLSTTQKEVSPAPRFSPLFKTEGEALAYQAGTNACRWEGSENATTATQLLSNESHVRKSGGLPEYSEEEKLSFLIGASVALKDDKTMTLKQSDCVLL